MRNLNFSSNPSLKENIGISQESGLRSKLMTSFQRNKSSHQELDLNHSSIDHNEHSLRNKLNLSSFLSNKRNFNMASCLNTENEIPSTKHNNSNYINNIYSNSSFRSQSILRHGISQECSSSPKSTVSPIDYVEPNRLNLSMFNKSANIDILNDKVTTCEFKRSNNFYGKRQLETSNEEFFDAISDNESNNEDFLIKSHMNKSNKRHAIQPYTPSTVVSTGNINTRNNTPFKAYGLPLSFVDTSKLIPSYSSIGTKYSHPNTIYNQNIQLPPSAISVSNRRIRTPLRFRNASFNQSNLELPNINSTIRPLTAAEMKKAFCRSRKPIGSLSELIRTNSKANQSETIDKVINTESILPINIEIPKYDANNGFKNDSLVTCNYENTDVDLKIPDINNKHSKLEVVTNLSDQESVLNKSSDSIEFLGTENVESYESNGVDQISNAITDKEQKNDKEQETNKKLENDKQQEERKPETVPWWRANANKPNMVSIDEDGQFASEELENQEEEDKGKNLTTDTNTFQENKLFTFVPTNKDENTKNLIGSSPTINGNNGKSLFGNYTFQGNKSTNIDLENVDNQKDVKTNSTLFSSSLFKPINYEENKISNDIFASSTSFTTKQKDDIINAESSNLNNGSNTNKIVSNNLFGSETLPKTMDNTPITTKSLFSTGNSHVDKKDNIGTISSNLFNVPKLNNLYNDDNNSYTVPKSDKQSIFSSNMIETNHNTTNLFSEQPQSTCNTNLFNFQNTSNEVKQTDVSDMNTQKSSLSLFSTSNMLNIQTDSNTLKTNELNMGTIPTNNKEEPLFNNTVNSIIDNKIETNNNNLFSGITITPSTNLFGNTLPSNNQSSIFNGGFSTSNIQSSLENNQGMNLNKNQLFSSNITGINSSNTNELPNQNNLFGNPQQSTLSNSNPFNPSQPKVNLFDQSQNLASSTSTLSNPNPFGSNFSNINVPQPSIFGSNNSIGLTQPSTSVFAQSPFNNNLNQTNTSIFGGQIINSDNNIGGINSIGGQTSTNPFIGVSSNPIGTAPTTTHRRRIARAKRSH